MEKKSDYTEGKWFSDEKGYVWRRDPKDLYQNGGGVAGDMPIAVCGRGWYGDSEGYPEAGNARRIVACVNSCKNYTTEDLEEVGENLSSVFADVRARCADLVAQRDELLAAIEGYLPYMPSSTAKNGGACGHSENLKASDRLKDAFAKCEVQS